MGQAPPALTHVHTNTGIGRHFQGWYFSYLTTCFQSTPGTAPLCVQALSLQPLLSSRGLAGGLQWPVVLQNKQAFFSFSLTIPLFPATQKMEEQFQMNSLEWMSLLIFK